MKTKLLKLKSIQINEKLYPRVKCSWQTTYDYAESMKAGAKFPPIIVALYKGNYYLVDGRHRLEAYRLNKEEYVQAEVMRNKTEHQIYLEAVKRNISHGRPFSVQEKVGIIKRLQDIDYDLDKISKIVNIPVKRIKQFIVTKVTSTLSGEPVILKAPLEHFAGIQVSDDFEQRQDKFSAHSQIDLLDQTINLLENELIDLTDDEVVKKLEKLALLINRLVKPGKEKRKKYKK